MYEGYSSDADTAAYGGGQLKQVLATVISNAEVMPGANLMWLEAPYISAAAQPGQFVTVRCEDCVLRRPFSVHQVRESQVALLFKVVGKGTGWLSERREGDMVDVLGPLGNGFSFESGAKRLLLVAGGIGIAPLVFVVQRVSSRKQVTLIRGASSSSQLYPFSSRHGRREGGGYLPDEVRLVSVTEDGSMGKGGLVTDFLPEFLEWADQICACGPVDMYKAMTALRCHSEEEERGSNVVRRGLPGDSKLKQCQISLEVRMGCGVGACYGCSIDTRKGMRRVCRDGPIFELEDILWEEVAI